MEQKSASIWKSTFVSGIYLGIVLILISVVFYVMGNPTSKVAQYLTYPVLIAGVIYGQINYKKTLNGTMSYGQALGAGILTVVFASLISGIYTFVMHKFVDPSLQEQMRIAAEEQILKQGNVTEEQLDVAMSLTSKLMTPVMLFFSAIFGGALSGLIVSLITSIFTQKKPVDDFVE
jgi:prepilin signal peptidase PulO-like enzyme (type II secretory pathway)